MEEEIEVVSKVEVKQEIIPDESHVVEHTDLIHEEVPLEIQE